MVLTVTWWRVDAETVATSRFVVSELAEATAALILLHRDRAALPHEREWLRAHRPAYLTMIAADPPVAALVRAALGRQWLADFLSPPPAAGPAPFATAVEAVRSAPPDRARHDIRVTLDRELPPELDRDDLPELGARLLEWVWHHTVQPTWHRRRQLVEADIVARTRQLSLAGWAAAVADLRGEMRWLGDGRLQINAYDYPVRDISGAPLLFVPVTIRAGWVSWHDPHPDRYAVIYPCAAPLSEADHTVPPDALARLLGPARARVLLLLETPKTTTQLTAVTGQVLGSIGRHLTILHDAGLVLRRRTGRTVLYSRTAVGDALTTASAPPPPPP
ncbi:ArsR/SmtB family transcription factor [Actinoplanes sp. GCM10030250]|uniref:ArsR/SmtB family transcription factor n=1 Tax=Actinoplanes sp. GCM10030250 TaxID=3273376 RepID=UPI00360A5F92